MRVLLLGSGGRESAMATALQRSAAVGELIAAPGNPGIARAAEICSIDAADPIEVCSLAERCRPDLVLVGPEAPLVAGVSDALREKGYPVFGPDREAARIEGSKSFAKELMERSGIATARGEAFRKVAPALAHMDALGPPYVVKADGLAAGKGVLVTEDWAEAVRGIEERLVGDRFGDAGRTVVIEEFLDGEELSVIAFSDGRTVLPCPPAQDYKRALDGDKGLNTGGMGSYSPVPSCSDELAAAITEEVIEPMVAALAARGTPFVGAIYAGLALTERGPRVIEFNARFGDPETQALLPRLESDFAELCLASTTGQLEGTKLHCRADVCVAVVVASKGYPGPHETGLVIGGIEQAESVAGVEIFHSGTRLSEGELRTGGGRVLAVSALGEDFSTARARAYEAVSCINFEGAHWRTDIALRRATGARTRMSAAPIVGIIMGSDSDREVMDKAGGVLDRFDVPFEIEVMSAHRNPGRVAAYATGASERGLKVIIAGAGMAAHLPGVVAAHTVLPVIGVPLYQKALGGQDALYSCVQMPPGVPVATVAIDGAKNAAVLACQILALGDGTMAAELAELKNQMSEGFKL